MIPPTGYYIVIRRGATSEQLKALARPDRQTAVHVLRESLPYNAVVDVLIDGVSWNERQRE